MGGRHAAGALIVAIGCGRVGFDPLADSATKLPDAAFALPCPLGSTAPDPLVISGRTVQVNSLGMYVDEPSVMVSIVETSTGAPLAMTTSSATTGDFTVSVPTGGTPRMTIVRLDKATLVSTQMVPDQPFDTSVAIGSTAFVSSSGAMSTLYSAGGIARDMARGTLIAQVRDCSNTPIVGATITLTPAPATIVYANALGTPDATQTSTNTNGGAWGLNAPPGPVEITASKNGVTFAHHIVEVLAGDNVVFTPVRPLP